MYAFADEWAKGMADVRLPAGRRMLPPLLWYRNRLRAVWSRNDQHGYNLTTLYGLEKEAQDIAREHPGDVETDALASPILTPGQPVDPAKHNTVGGLPRGRPVINGVTGEIRWEFGCPLQEAVYDLMQARWRAKVCPQCGRFFIAAKTAQKVCSARCSDDAKRGRALTYWNETGKNKRRAKARTK